MEYILYYFFLSIKVSLAFQYLQLSQPENYYCYSILDLHVLPQYRLYHSST